MIADPLQPELLAQPPSADLVRPWQWHPHPASTMHTKWLYAGVAKLRSPK